MEFIPAFLVKPTTEEEKNRLRAVGAIWSLNAQGWFITQDQKAMLDTDTGPKPSASGILIQEVNIDLNIPEAGSEWKITGNTYSKRDLIKNLGGRWKAQDRSWRIPLSKVTSAERLQALLA